MSDTRMTRLGDIRLVPKPQPSVSVTEAEAEFDEGFETLGEVVDGQSVERPMVSYGKYVPPLECPTCKFPISDDSHGWLVPAAERNRQPGGKVEMVPCPTCSGDAQVKMAMRRQAELVQRLFGGADIPWSMKEWEFANFPQTGDTHAVKSVQEFVRRHLAGDETLRRGLWLGGDLGHGKTSLAVSALKVVIRASQIGLFVSSSDLFNRMRASFRDSAEEHADELLEAVKNVRWLVLDDLGVERPTGYVIEQLYGIISLRMQRGLYTIFTSNFTPRDLESYWTKDDASGVAGRRIISRLKEYCVAVTVKGSNLREKAV